MTMVAICLGVLCLVLVAIAYRLFKAWEASRRTYGDPAVFSGVLEMTINRINETNDWERLEVLRRDLRRGLREVNALRHDVGNADLRASKTKFERTD